MDPPHPPLPTPTSTAPTAGAVAGAGAGVGAGPGASTVTTIQLNYSDSVDSSPRSRNAETWVDDNLPQVPGAKLRLMCSYGGHIIPRPHDKSLCYVGGETRIVVAERHSSLSDLCARLSRTLLNGRPFTLKYQLPREDLDSLISVTTDEDLENMIEEYDRTVSASPSKPSRLRLFLFFSKPETTVSMGALLDDAKSETWFVDALNGSAYLPRNLSDSATMDCLLSLDAVRGNDSSNDLEAQGDHFLGDSNKQVTKNVHDLHNMPDSPMVENTSSFGSSSSSPSMSNLPPIRVRVDDNVAGSQQDQKVGIEEQFAQISFAPPSHPTAMAAASSGTVISTAQINTMAVSGENMNRVFSDDERSDHGAPVAFRKPPLPLQPVQVQKPGGFGLPSPDSIASDSSIASATSLSKPTYYHQEQVHVQPREVRGPASPSTMSDNSDVGSGNFVHQVKESGYVIPPQLDQQQQQQQPQQQQFVQQPQQQQFVHAGTQFIHHPATGPVPISSYYPIYASQAQQQYHHPIDQQYPVYVMPAPQKQPYNMAETTVVSSSRPLPSPSPPIVPTSATYKDGIPPVYPTKTASPAVPEMGSNTLYKTPVNSTPPPPLVQIPPQTQFQQQYVGYTQMHHHPSQSIAVASSAAANYGFEYANPSHEQVYYTQHPATPLPSQYQTLTPAAAAIALSDAAKQPPTDNTQQIRTSQPL
ncbi:hypothetical protein FEM48_Zijuj05G0100000 [Ziziphus jujuba var. spinosa]|uniref:PB1 domain-containing protein n=1 Tax=Ziziphus jujuba var. spinosa TaxID=714518 RepID=A0A978VEB2_ZIZJJ|nr:hypothetical protein FEM48_Zijuj05G0100000 [Ziziphus jujuba var. spinosa]